MAIPTKDVFQRNFKVLAEGGRSDGEGDVEKEDNQ